MKAATWSKGSPLPSYFFTSFYKADGLTFLPSLATPLGGLLASDSVLGRGIALEPYVPPGSPSTLIGCEVIGWLGLGLGFTVPVELLKGCMDRGSPSMA